MKVHLHQIPEGGVLPIEGEEDPAFLGLEEAGAVPASPLRYTLDVGLSDGGIFATGELEIQVTLKCVACLEEFSMNLQVAPFSLQKELDGREMVDLTPEVREDIHLALPAYPRCDAGGQKTCPASFPQVPAEAPQPSATAAWDALDKLKTKD